MKKGVICTLLALLLIIACITAAEQADLTVAKSETAEVKLVPGSLFNVKMSEGSRIIFTYEDKENTLEIKEISTKETKVKLSLDDQWGKTITIPTGEPYGIDFGGSSLAEVDITPKIVKNIDDPEKKSVVLEFNNYIYKTTTGQQISYNTKGTEMSDSLILYFVGAIVLLFVILLFVWKKKAKKETPSTPTKRERFNEEDVYVSGTIERKPTPPQIPIMSILTDEPKASQYEKINVDVKGAKIETKKKIIKKTKKRKAK